MIPDLDSQIGISVYSTQFAGIGGSIRDSPEDFEVSEVISEKAMNSIKPDGNYAVYVLKKRQIDTNHAVSDVFRKRGIRIKPLGLKDASAVTEQFACAGGKGSGIEGHSSKRYSLTRIGFLSKPLSKRDMIGNHFKIKIRGCSGGLESFDDSDRILNFYGYQRFGSKRPVTHLIGRAILQRDFEKAVELILSFTSPYDSAENTELREKLVDPANFASCLDQVPSRMDVERTVLKAMIEHGDCLRAVRAVPLALRRFYVQAYQSFLFNCYLSSAFQGCEDLFAARSGDVCFDSGGTIGKFVNGVDQSLALPFVGHSYYKKTRFDSYIAKVLEQEDIAPRDFFIKEMQEVSGEGGFRQAAINCSNYSSIDNSVEFTLSRGSFATILLREIMKPADPILAGF